MISPQYWPDEDAGYTKIHPELSLWNVVHFYTESSRVYNLGGTIRLHDKRLELDELTVHRKDREITGFGLREVQPPELIRRSLLVLSEYPTNAFSVDHLLFDEVVSGASIGLASHEEIEEAKAQGPSSQKLLRLVSRIYIGAVAVQNSPAKAIQESFDVSPRTAGNWIAKAKDAGYIDG